jgi:hypothetical protein
VILQKRQRAVALQDASRVSEDDASKRQLLDCGSPLPLLPSIGP